MLTRHRRAGAAVPAASIRSWPGSSSSVAAWTTKKQLIRWIHETAEMPAGRYLGSATRAELPSIRARPMARNRLRSNLKTDPNELDPLHSPKTTFAWLSSAASRMVTGRDRGAPIARPFRSTRGGNANEAMSLKLRPWPGCPGHPRLSSPSSEKQDRRMPGIKPGIAGPYEPSGVAPCLQSISRSPVRPQESISLRLSRQS